MLAPALLNLLPLTTKFTAGIFDKIAFDLDVIGRQREITLIEEQARLAYTKAGTKVNIAVWNMHIPEQHAFQDILDSGMKPMGRGGGFRIVVFRGGGFMHNGGAGGLENWLCTGNKVERDGVVTFAPAESWCATCFFDQILGGLQIPGFG